MRGRPVRYSRGKKYSNRLYIQLKNRAVYVFPRPLTAAAMARAETRLFSAMEKGQTIALKQWKKVR